MVWPLPFSGLMTIAIGYLFREIRFCGRPFEILNWFKLWSWNFGSHKYLSNYVTAGIVVIGNKLCHRDAYYNTGCINNRFWVIIMFSLQSDFTLSLHCDSFLDTLRSFLKCCHYFTYKFSNQISLNCNTLQNIVIIVSCLLSVECLILIQFVCIVSGMYHWKRSLLNLRFTCTYLP